MYVSLTPAYGRDYATKRSALADYNAGKDFMLRVFDQPERLINKSQCQAEGFNVTIYFFRNTKSVNAD